MESYSGGYNFCSPFFPLSMDHGLHPDDKPSSNTVEFKNDAQFSSSRGGIFSGSTQFTVSGGTFTNITNNHSSAPTLLPPDFRIVPLGDIDLRREIQWDHDHSVPRLRERHSVRRVYSAKIDGRKRTVTVALYQGDNAKETWREDVKKYMAARHPNIVQLWGVTDSNNLQGTIFNDDLVPLEQFVNLHKDSHFAMVHLYASSGVQDYFISTFGHRLEDYDCTFYMRRSTGRFCADLIPSEIWPFRSRERGSTLAIDSLRALNTESAVTEYLTILQYHEICRWILCLPRFMSISSRGSISEQSWPQLIDISALTIEIAILPHMVVELDSRRWSIPECYSPYKAVDGDLMENGWTRFSCSDVIGTTINVSSSCLDPHFWLSQANHIFSRVAISVDLKDFVLFHSISFQVDVSQSAPDAPEGYLFLCPPEDFRTGPSSFRLPDRPIYWSFDHTGAECISAEDAADLGFPLAKTFIRMWGISWDSAVYAGLREFHQVKGFDPDSQDLARYLGHELYDLSTETNTSLSQIEAAELYSSVGMDHESKYTQFSDDYVDEEAEQSASNLIPEPSTRDIETPVGAHHEYSASESTNADEETACHRHREQIPPVSETLKVLVYLQLTLLLFLAFFWLNDQM
ncbi:hypothetical protein K438DRAFT_1883799 [Mycena galopus ATCC 62051]|nr:hypothetical protein K438DRAFT_1883799 [Mycena galopus ATCC 62051]